MLTKEQALAAIEILNEECEANIRRPYDYGFISYVTSDDDRRKEWRFQGALGFGGKFRINHNKPHPYVDCYPEHETPERLAMIERANARLALISVDPPAPAEPRAERLGE
jgi:hypothetical protein